MDTNLLFQASLGHNKCARHPRMSPFLLPRTGISIDLINPVHIQESLGYAALRIGKLRAECAQLLWVGSRTHAHLLQALHQATGEPVLHQRWPGGLLTNFPQVSRSTRGQLPGLRHLPDAVILLSAHRSALALQEARACGIEVIGVVDSNMDPGAVDVPIFGNDDACSVIKHYLAVLG